MTVHVPSVFVPSPSLMLVLVASVLTGCQHVDYYAHRLPVEYQAQRIGTHQPVDLARLAQRAYQSDRIYPGDLLEMTLVTGIEEQPPLPLPVRVSTEGRANVPLVGDVPVAGLTLPEAEQAIRQQCMAAQIYRDPHVSLSIQQRHTIKVRVIGQVQMPGVYELPVAGSDLLAALVAAGGLSEKAGTLVDIRHPSIPLTLAEAASGPWPAGIPQPATDPQPPEDAAGQSQVRLASHSAGSPGYLRVDLMHLAGKAAVDLNIQDGSVVVVHPKAPRNVHLIGLVRKPDAYELPEDTSLRVLDAIALAGGTTLSIADKVHVIRQVEGREQPLVTRTSLRRAKYDGGANLVLQGGDVVSVEETPTTFVVDTLRSFIRFGFSSTVPGL
jgi:polysaccharide export outer membrane protein